MNLELWMYLEQVHRFFPVLGFLIDIVLLMIIYFLEILPSNRKVAFSLQTTQGKLIKKAFEQNQKELKKKNNFEAKGREANCVIYNLFEKVFDIRKKNYEQTRLEGS